ncbi:ferritin [Acetivibrio cellulolyticus]|uniref:ferritin n=1 Tax=Acetivibrio cellulolyticus TaxID=35830 RepID=UPI0001E2E2B1|nr:ferritin [Acetivibrio cellulolyticus]
MQQYNTQPMFNGPVIGYTVRQGETSRISPSMQKVINDLIQVDLNSAYLYISMSNYLNRNGFSGFGSFLRAQYTEELKHADTLINYLSRRGGVVEIKQIPAQPVNFGSLLDTFQALLEHEQLVTKTYTQALNIAIRENDIQSQSVIRTAIDEQVDEEAVPAEIIDKIKMTGGNSAALLMLDQQYGQMAAQPAAPGQGG